MSLTEEAYSRRMWEKYPQLRNVLQKPLGESIGYTSASDNIFDYVNRLITIQAMAQEHAEEIKRQLGNQPINRKLKDELIILSSELDSMSDMFQSYAQNIRKII